MDHFRKYLVLVAACISLEVDAQRRAPLEFEINLDEEPEKRFTAVMQHFNSTLWSYYGKSWMADKFLSMIAKNLVSKRGPENDELQREIKGYSAVTRIPEDLIHAAQMAYELNTIMVPLTNFTWPWSGPGCTGIVAQNKADGMVYHARNLDFSPKDFMQGLTYVGIFKRGGVETFRAQMIAGYSCIVTGMKNGPNGFSMETNTRFANEKTKFFTQTMHNLFTEKRTLNGWAFRKVLETASDYESAVEALSTAPIVATYYNIVGGARKGTILARSPDDVEYKMTLGQPNYENRDDYIIMTNFDYFWGDVREWFDPTGGHGIGHPRRIEAQRILNKTSVLTPEVLFSTINDVGVRAPETIFQAIMNVETGLWNVSLPDMSAPDEHPLGEVSLKDRIPQEFIDFLLHSEIVV